MEMEYKEFEQALIALLGDKLNVFSQGIVSLESTDIIKDGIPKKGISLSVKGDGFEDLFLKDTGKSDVFIGRPKRPFLLVEAIYTTFSPVTADMLDDISMETIDALLISYLNAGESDMASAIESAVVALSAQ